MGAHETTTSEPSASMVDTTLIPPYMSPYICKEGVLNSFEKLANLLRVGWKYHIARTDGIKEAWTNFEAYYNHVCSFTAGNFSIFGLFLKILMKTLFFFDFSSVQWRIKGLNASQQDRLKL